MRHGDLGKASIDYDIADVVGFNYYRNGTIQVIRAKQCLSFPTVDMPTRGRIRHLSARARTRLMYIVKETGVKFESMATLTYGLDYPKDGIKVKSDISRMLKVFKGELGVSSYLWFLEFQRRGAPHVHIFLDCDVGDRLAFAYRWARIASDSLGEQLKMIRVHAHERSWEVIRLRDGVARYAAKYCLKPEQKTVPFEYQNVGRFWGASRDVGASIPSVECTPVSEKELRDYLSDLGHAVAEWEVLPKYIFT